MRVDDLAAAFASTRGVMANVTADQYLLPTPCAAWNVGALINHVVAGSHWFAATALAGQAQPTTATDYTGGDPLATFDEGIAASLAAFANPAVLEKSIVLPHTSTPMPGSAFIGLAVQDTFTHGWDLARATGQPSDLDPQLARAVLVAARQSFPDELRGTEPESLFGPVVDVPDTAPAADQLAGFLGRKP